ncbi:hypothetical protein [Paenibacillus agilis]|uniref:Uncharacterized protein n=1 Tax=Paenibacillus agilis TaxID=3020863 RepID=A0A559IIB1_9BACL|nr:hypothetical protein [Paenibacillus agilis]TVX87250.1 hypothetical protein FPZ44_22485 [Paenibacillus agilis]
MVKQLIKRFLYSLMGKKSSHRVYHSSSSHYKKRKHYAPTHTHKSHKYGHKRYKGSSRSFSSYFSS